MISGIKKKAPINAREKAKVRTAACVLMKKEKQGRVSQIGGGKAFRQSQVNGKPSNMSIT